MKHMRHAPITRLLVRNARSRKFLKATGGWTKKPDAAWNFPNPVNAIHVCLEKGLREVELILRFEGDKRDRRLPVNCR